MIDILIPLGTGSRYDNLELRFCLRSIEKHLKNYGNIFIIGEKSDWLQNIIHIPFKESEDNKHRAYNIYSKIMAGINYNKNTVGEDMGMKMIKLSDNFLFMNDDHFLLTDYEASEFPYYHRGIVELHRQGNEAQKIQYQNSYNVLKWQGIEFLDFGIHCPVVYNKELFRNAFKDLIWVEYGFEIKSIYGNTYRGGHVLNYEECEDLKFSEPAMKESIYKCLEGRSFFSTGDKVLSKGGMQDVLAVLYPVKSKYEV